MATIGALIYRIGADTSELVKNARHVDEDLTRLERMAQRVKSTFAGMFTIGAMGAAISKYTEMTGTLMDLHQKTGLSTTALQTLGYAAKLSGSNLEDVSHSALFMSKTLVEGDKSTVGTLRTLGLSFTDLRNMQPDQAFFAIADAIAKVPNPMEQSTLGTKLLGKTFAELLPMMKGNLRETAAEALRLGLVMSEEAVAGGEALGDSLDRLKLIGGAMLGQVLTPMVPILTTLATWLGKLGTTVIAWLTKSIYDLIGAGARAIAWLYDMAAAAVDVAAKYGGPLAKALGIDSDTARGLRESAQWYRDAASVQTTLAGAVDKTAASANRLAPPIRTASEAIQDGARAARDMAKGLTEVTKSLEASTDAWVKYANAQFIAPKRAALPALMEELLAGVPSIAISRGLEQLPAGGTRSLESLFAGGAMSLPGASAQNAVAGVSITDAAVKWYSSLTSALPQVMMAALTGGGNVMRSIGGSLGGKLLSGTIGKTITSGLGSVLGSAIGGAVGSIVPGLGTLVGSVLGGKLGKLFGPSKGLLEGRAADAQIRELQEGLLATYGSLDGIRQIGGAAGDALAAAWGSKNVAGLEWFRARIDAFTEAVDQQRLTTENAQNAIRAKYEETYSVLHSRLESLDTELASLQKFVDAEAPEEVMGVMEAAARARIAGLALERASLEEQMQPVLEALEHMGDVIESTGQQWAGLAGAAQDAMREMPTTHTLTITRRYVDEGVEGEAEGAAFGGLVTRASLLHLAGGGRVLAFRPRGTDTIPAMLTPNEFVMNAGAVAHYGAGTMAALNRRTIPIGSDAGGRAAVTQTIIVQLDGRILAQATARELPGVLRLAGAA